MILIHEIVSDDDVDGGRSPRGVIVALQCGGCDSRGMLADSELLRRVTTMVDYVLHTVDVEAGEDLIAAFTEDAKRGGLKALRSLLDHLIAVSRAERERHERAVRACGEAA